MKTQDTMMESESEIVNVSPKITNQGSDFFNFKLLKTTAYAKLYRASKLGKYFLIKTTKDNTPQQHLILRREYDLSIACDHAHIVHVYTFEENLPIGAGLVMEYIEGRTLNEYLAEKPAVKERQRIFDELLSAVEYLHKKTIIHNDLKPENILVSRADNSLKIIDFGLADSDFAYVYKNLGCTPQYASPELLEHQSIIDARSDIYSIGILLKKVFGNRYFHIVKRCTKKKPKDRFENISALRRAIIYQRNRIKRLCYSLFAIVFSILLFSFIYDVSKEKKQQSVNERILSELESVIDSVCSATTDSIEQSRYYEFAYLHIQAMSEQCNTYVKQLLFDIDNPSLEAVVSTRFSSIYQQYWESVIKHASSLPSYRMVSLDIEMWHFYDSLIELRHHYIPFSSTE